MRSLLRLCALAALAIIPAPPRAEPPPPAPAPHEMPPGDGVLCAYAIYGSFAEVGERCDVHPDPAFQAELRRSATRLAAYIRANAHWSEEKVDRFTKEQAQVGRPAAQLCTAETMGFYRQMAERNTARQLAEGVDKTVARAGPPTWGLCL
jgi:hypothetical protein